MAVTRRDFLLGGASGIGSIALASLLGAEAAHAEPLAGLPHFPPKARRIVFLFQSGAPSQLESFDYKPGLVDLAGTDLPPSVRNGQRLTTMSSSQTRFPVFPSLAGFQQHGQSGTFVCDLFPHTAQIVDDLCVVRTLHTDAINHDPGMTFMQTGSEQPGRPSFGAWLSYGLGRITDNLPSFVVLISRNNMPALAQPLNSRLFGSGFLPTVHQGVQFRAGREPVLYLRDGTDASSSTRSRLLGTVEALERKRLADAPDPRIESRIADYALAARMQTAVPEATDLSTEPESTFDLYGPDARVPGSHAANCLMARRLLERGVRFVQLYHRDWDSHSRIRQNAPRLAQENDRGSAALVTDLKQRGLLEDTIVVWGAEFGRTVYSQGDLNEVCGRDHHGRCFSIWLAGAGINAGTVYGQTDDFSYNIVENGVHVHDLHATLLHLLGIDHQRLTYRYLGRDFRLTDVAGQVVPGLLA